MDATENRACKSCSGSGKSSYAGKCNGCEGNGSFPPVDAVYILKRIAGKKGLRSTPPPYTGEHNTIANRRAYYVWRNARFHGGIDVTLPMLAGIIVHGDPFVSYLDGIVDVVAKRVCGTNLAAAYRWGGLLSNGVTVPAGQPATAYPSGPVLTAEKPEEELLELY